jgi:hypothetical protein
LRQIVFNELNRRFKRHDQRYQFILQWLQTRRKLATHLPYCLLCGSIGLSIDQVTNRLSLTQVHFAVTQRPKGEFTWASHTTVEAQYRIDYEA